MIDFHSHILPNMDDGSQSVSMSLEMLTQSRDQGVTTLLATPHFYGHKETPMTFLSRRGQAWKILAPQLDDTAPEIFLGAEMAYYRGVSDCEYLQDFCIQGTRLLLLELPFAPCTEQCYREIRQLRDQGFWPLIAHVERYFALQSPGKFVARLREMGGLIQCNGDFFLQGWRSRRAFSMLNHGLVDAIGSDCHNLTQRKPNLGATMAEITRKRGAVMTQELLQREQKLWQRVQQEEGFCG